MKAAVVLWPTGRRYCAQTLAPDRCRCCQPDRSGTLPPEEKGVGGWGVGVIGMEESDCMHTELPKGFDFVFG